MDGFYVSSVKSQWQTYSLWGFESLASATGKVAYEWIECL